MNKYLKITRKRSVFRYLCDIDSLAFKQGNENVLLDSLRWTRLQLCINSIQKHLLDVFGVGYKV